MTGKEKATAPVLSVGADGKQPLSKSNKKSIAELPPKGNLQATESCPVESEKMQNKDELQTVSMTELYDTVYPPKIPIVDGLIYAGTYLFVGAPKVGKSFFMAQLGYHVSMGLDLWIIRCERVRFYILPLRMIMRGCRSVCRGCSVWRAVKISTSPHSPKT